MKPTQLLELILRALPYSNQIKDLEMEDAAVRFVWRSQRFRVSTTRHVETIGYGVLIGDDASILFQAMLQRELIRPNADMRRDDGKGHPL